MNYVSQIKIIKIINYTNENFQNCNQYNYWHINKSNDQIEINKGIIQQLIKLLLYLFCREKFYNIILL